jgi:hypothetical protein
MGCSNAYLETSRARNYDCLKLNRVDIFTYLLEQHMFSISVLQGDLSRCQCDLLVLKHADGFYGVDKQIAKAIGFESNVPVGAVRLMPGRNTKATRVAFVGVGPLADFGYQQIREFGRMAIAVAPKQRGSNMRICMPIHGPGYGLDEAEAFSSLVAGIVDAADDEWALQNVAAIEIVEINPSRARRFDAILKGLLSDSGDLWGKKSSLGYHSFLKIHETLRAFGSNSELKTKLFVAMPFRKEFDDEWEISIQEAASSLQILTERVDKSAFVGDIAAEIKRRIEQYDGLIALLNGANPNVFLELGYAWAKNKPTILLVKEGQELPFDVRGQRCIFYEGIKDLRTKLKSELEQLQANGVFRRT